MLTFATYTGDQELEALDWRKWTKGGCNRRARRLPELLSGVPAAGPVDRREFGIWVCLI